MIIPTYQQQDLLFDTLQSLARQQYTAEAVEIIVVDDASPDFNPGKFLEATGPYPLKIIRHSSNQGRARARNTGIGTASGDLIVFLDSDLTVNPDFFQAHATFHQAYSNAVVIGDVRFGPQIPINCLTRYVESRGVHRLSEGAPVPFKCFVTTNSSVRREQLLRVGLFDEEFTAYGGEDLELGYRLHLDGATFHYAPSALSLHHHLRTLDQLCQVMYTYGRKSLPVLLHKHPELSDLLRINFLDASPLSFKRLLLHSALLPPVYHAVFQLVRGGLQHYVPDILFDYLIWYNRTRGYLHSGRANMS